MRKTLFSFLLSLMILATGACQTDAPTTPVTVFTDVVVIDMTGAAPQAAATVVVEGGLISEIGPANQVQVPPGAVVIDGSGKYLIPGLWDMHMHVSLLGGPDILPVFTAYGITGVRDQGSPDSIFVWKKEIEEGTRVGPRIVSAGQYVIATEVFGGESTVLVESPAEAEGIVARLAAAGAEYIKVQDGLMPRDMWLAIAREAKRSGLPLAGHPPVDVALTEAIREGLISIEHTIGLPLALTRAQESLRMGVMAATADPFEAWAELFRADAEALSALDDKRLRDLAELMIERGVALDPTLTDSRAMATASSGRWNDDPRLAFLPPDIRDAWREASKDAFYGGENAKNLQRMYERVPSVVGRLHAMGVTMLAGTDAGATFDFPGSDIHTELALFVDAGLTPMEALQTATLNPAVFLGMEQSLGTIEVGKRADLVLLEADPLSDIRNTERIAGVMQGGRYYDRSDLDSMLEAARKKNQR